MEILLTAAIVHLVAVLSPGPDVLLVIRNSVTFGTRIGILTTAGIVTGVSLQISACLTGFAILVSQSPKTEIIISHLGALYLIYLGIRGCLPSTSDASTKNVLSPKISEFRAFRQGFITNILNPKAILYFLSLFTVLLDPNVTAVVQLAAGIEMVLLQFSAFSILAWALGKGSRRIAYPKFQVWFGYGVSAVFILLGVNLILQTWITF